MEPSEQFIIADMIVVDDRLCSKLSGIAAKFFTLFSGPKPKIQNDADTLGQKVLGEVPQQPLYYLMSEVVLGMFQIITEQANMPIVRRESDCWQFLFQLPRSCCLP